MNECMSDSLLVDSLSKDSALGWRGVLPMARSFDFVDNCRSQYVLVQFHRAASSLYSVILNLTRRYRCQVEPAPRGESRRWALERDRHRAWEEQVEGVVSCSLRGAWSPQTLSQGLREEAVMHFGNVSEPAGQASPPSPDLSALNLPLAPEMNQQVPASGVHCDTSPGTD